MCVASSLGHVVALKKEGPRGRNMGVVTVNNNKVGKILLNFRQGKELFKHLPFVDFQNVCAWKWEGKYFSLIWVGTHFCIVHGIEKS